MFLNIPDLELIQQRRQQLIDANLHRQNQRRRFMDYRVGQQVLLKASDNRKLNSPTLGPFTLYTPMVRSQLKGLLISGNGFTFVVSFPIAFELSLYSSSSLRWEECHIL